MERVRSELHASAPPPEGTLQALRRDLETLARALHERDVPSHGDMTGMRWTLRRVLAGLHPLARALARSGIDTVEARRLARALAVLAAVPSYRSDSSARSGMQVPPSTAAAPVDGPAPRHSAPSEAPRAVAYTRTAAAPSTVPTPETTPAALIRAAAHPGGGISVLDLAAVALLLVLALSASLSYLVMRASAAGVPAD